MLIQKITWGLGNQMFQYAYVKAQSLRNKQDFRLDISGFEYYKLHKYCLEIFDIEKKYSSKNMIPFYEKLCSKNKFIDFWLSKLKWILQKINKKHFLEEKFNFNPHLLTIQSGYIEGYFQTEKYFIDFKDEIKGDFKFTIPPSEKNKDIIDIINGTNSISIHIRRWDYISNVTTNSFHGTCHLDYYKKAIEVIQSKVTDPIFFVFSDDINWCKENIKIRHCYYIDWNNADSNYEDMRLMSLCKHNIIANSSFSWRWAWLNNNKDKIVITPKKWFNNSEQKHDDIVPYNWLKL